MKVFPFSVRCGFRALARADARTGAVLAYRGHLLTGNLNGLVVSTLTTRAYGSTERNAALLMAESLPGRHYVTLGGDRGYDFHDFIAELRQMEITPQVAQNDTHRRSAVDERTTSQGCIFNSFPAPSYYPTSNQKLTPTSCDFLRTAVKFHNGTKN